MTGPGKALDPDDLWQAKGVQCLSEDPKSRCLLIETLARLPDDPRAFAVHKCVFISVGRERVLGRTFPPGFMCEKHADDWLIVLSEDAPDPETNIAHEVAHAFLGHSSGSETEEREVRALVREWGFSGIGADE